MTAPNPPQRLQSLSEEYQKLQTDLQTQVTSRQRLESQQQENLAVRKEFNTLSDDSPIYKLIGPVLLKQEKTEAESAVDGRLEFIEKEIKRVEQLISDMQEQSEGKKMEVSHRECALFYPF
ncbi:MAG: hypothetical protein LQ339_000622 [Xanthoria mediterranea]|nr:MAG: hypothetical protein LQ339_000622 [Xanthoria mediterranea]